VWIAAPLSRDLYWVAARERKSGGTALVLWYKQTAAAFVEVEYSRYDAGVLSCSWVGPHACSRGSDITFLLFPATEKPVLFLRVWRTRLRQSLHG
jgi:hypothetical protein